MTRRPWLVGLGVLALLLPHGVGAQSAAATTARPTGASGKGPGTEALLKSFSLGSQDGPVTVTADKLEFDYKTRILTYHGKVKVTQADLTLRSDQLRIKIDPDAPDQLREVVAEGKVRIDKGARKASGGRAVFDQATRTVVLSDQATLRDGPNEVAGERVVVYLDEERSVVEGGTARVRAVLFPPGSKTPSAADGDHGE